MNIYTVMFSEPYEGHPETQRETRIEVVSDTETRAIARATTTFHTLIEGISLYTMGGEYTTGVVRTVPIFDGLVVRVDDGSDR